MKRYYVYIMSSKTRTTHIGVTNNLERRVYEHKHKLVEGFTNRYNLTYLVYYAETNDVREAIAREKQLKGWTRAKKVALIEEMNPEWEDLSASWFDENQRFGKESDSSLRSSENRGRGEPCVRPLDGLVGQEGQQPAGRTIDASDRQEGEHKVRPYGCVGPIFIGGGGPQGHDYSE